MIASFLLANSAYLVSIGAFLVAKLSLEKP